MVGFGNLMNNNFQEPIVDCPEEPLENNPPEPLEAKLTCQDYYCEIIFSFSSLYYQSGIVFYPTGWNISKNIITCVHFQCYFHE